MKIVQVAVGVILNPNMQVLIARRAAHQHQGNRWEFPGGKVEPGETSLDAVSRELREELGINIHSAALMTEITHQYKDKKVKLAVYQVDQWQGDPVGAEGQPIRWVKLTELDQFQFPEANDEILNYLKRL